MPNPVAKKPVRSPNLNPVLALRYDGTLNPVLGHPLAATRFTGNAWLPCCYLLIKLGLSVIDKHINLPILGFHLGEGSISPIIVLNVYLDREKTGSLNRESPFDQWRQLLGPFLGIHRQEGQCKIDRMQPGP